MKTLKKLISILLISVMFCSCAAKTNPIAEAYSEYDTDDEKLEALCEDLFMEYVKNDALSFQSCIYDEDTMGIKLETVQLPRELPDDLDEEIQSAKDLTSFLKSLDKDTLSEENAFLLENLLWQSDLWLTDEDLLYFKEPLSPHYGSVYQIPEALGNFRLDNENDIQIYFELVKDTKAYVENLILFEKEKAKRGLLMSDFNLDLVLKECDELLKDPDNFPTIGIFKNQLKTHLPDLSEDAKAAYMEENEKLVREYMIPAYQYIYDEMSKLKGQTVNQGGIANFEKGREAYRIMLHAAISSDLSPEDVRDLLEDGMSEILKQLYYYVANNPDLFSDYENCGLDTMFSSPEEAIAFAKKKCEENYPEIPVDMEFIVNYMPEQLQDTGASAYYLLPPVDVTGKNYIYINPRTDGDAATNYITYTHEGYPGHMYAESYFNAMEPNPINRCFSYLGYVEGWATYESVKACDYLGLKEDVTFIISHDMLLNQIMGCLADYYVNYEGYTKEELKEYLSKYSALDDDTIETLYNSVIEAPCLFMPYAVGYFQFKAIHERVESELGSSYDEYNFYKFIIEIGHTNFELLNSKVDEYINAHKN